jgi:uncharacterized protein (DUF1501 family)
MKPTLPPDPLLLPDRRRILAGGVALFAGLGLAPRALAQGRRQPRPAAASDERALVLVQLSGGNDGLSTVVPFADDAYARVRRTLRIQPQEVLRLDAYRGLHPDLQGLKRVWDAGRLAIVEGAGSPAPTRSHFRSMEVWHAADEAGRVAGEGWVGRLCASAWPEAGHPELMVHVGEAVPYSLYSSRHSALAFELPSSYRWLGADAELAAYRQSAQRARASQAPEPVSGTLARLRAVHRDAEDSSARIRAAVESYRTPVSYPATPFGNGLRTIAALLEARVGARVLSIELGGFDTHSNQKGRHAELMRALDAGLTAFLTDLHGRSLADSTVVMAFSEFGRRVAENGSAGTDHGKAGPMFLAGKPVRGGLYGKHPSLSDLDQGDLRHTTDFRSAYGAVVEDWFGADQVPVLGKRWEPVRCIVRNA